jgi:5-oxoprolinase (ATP-hydrolysing) subunit A
MTIRSIDLNADMGEYANHTERANEVALMPLISSCSVACGGHAGDNDTMRNTVRLAKTLGVSIGAHPSYPDREGFGRRSLAFNMDALQDSLRAQINALKSILDAEGVTIAHVKPHGALYNDAAKNIDLAQLIAAAAGDTMLVGPPGSALESAATQTGLPFAAEGFVDRLYLADGALTPRSEPGAVIADIDGRARQALAIARGKNVQAAGGSLKLRVNTLCIHSDSPGAVKTAEQVRTTLEASGFEIRAFS